METEETNEKVAVRAIASFRQRGGYVANRNKVGGGRQRSGGSLYGNRFSPSEDYQDEVLLIPAAYETPIVNESGEVENVPTEYFFYRQHYDSRRRKYTHCSGGPYYRNRDRAKPCLGCFINRELTVWGDDNKIEKDSHVSYARAMRAYTLIHFHRYHWTEQMRGQEAVLNPTTGKPYMEWVRCLAPSSNRCWMCEQEVKSTEARRMHWSLGPTHHDSLEHHNMRISKNCVNCGSTKSVEWEAWVCPHCEYPHVERDTTRMGAKEIEELIIKPITCPNCGQRDFPREEYYCEGCGKQARRMSVFDLRLLVQKETTISSDGKSTKIHFESGALEPDPADKYKGMYEPMDLADIFKEDTLQDQSRKFEWDIPEEWRAEATTGGLPSGRSPVRGYSR